jgi:hypothetical protein
VIEERRLCVVEVADIVLGRIFGAARIHQFPNPMLELDRIVAFGDDVVLVKHVAEKMAVIEPVGDRLCDLVRQGFDPIPVVAPQRDVERDEILDLAAMDRALADCGSGGGKAVQKGLLALVIVTFEEIPVIRRKD